MIVPEFSRTSSVHGTVWYPIDFSRGQIIAELPDDLDPRLMPPGNSPHFGSDDPAAVLLLDDPDAGLIEAARRAMVPVVSPTRRNPAWERGVTSPSRCR